eukprot:CFRG7078T1
MSSNNLEVTRRPSSMSHSSVGDSTPQLPAKSFWEIDEYKRVVKRLDDGIHNCDIIQSMLKERAAAEKEYTKALEKWSTKWRKHYTRKPEYGSLMEGFEALVNQANQQATIHDTVSNNLIALADTEMPQYKKEQYSKNFIGHYKQTKAAEAGFAKAQAPWSKFCAKAISAKKAYDSACHTRVKAQDVVSSSIGSLELTTDQVRKLKDKLAKAQADESKTKAKYESAIANLNNDKPRYMNDMTTEFNLCQEIELHRINKVKDVTIQAVHHLDLNEVPHHRTMFSDALNHQTMIDAQADVNAYSGSHGVEQDMTWPTFEEFEESAGTSAANNNLGASGPAAGYGMDSFGQETQQQQYSQSNDHPVGSSLPDVNAAGGYGAGAVAGPVLRRASALYDYTAQDDDELTFVEGDEVQILEEADEAGWCKAELRGKVGLIPANYVE